MLSPLYDNRLPIKDSLFAGGFSTRNLSDTEGNFQIDQGIGSFHKYELKTEASKTLLYGYHKLIKLYPKDSVFASDDRVVAVLLPEEDVNQAVSRIRNRLFFLLLLLVIFGTGISFALSRRYLRPINKGLNIIRSENLKEAPKTMVPEIDDLIQFLSDNKEKLLEKSSSEGLSLSILNRFLENTKKLSPAEQAVFNLYVKGHTAREIADILYLSINTIKTHNKRIYSKLNVASREELLLYINMLKEAGKEFK